MKNNLPNPNTYQYSQYMAIENGQEVIYYKQTSLSTGEKYWSILRTQNRFLVMNLIRRMKQKNK